MRQPITELREAIRQGFRGMMSCMLRITAAIASLTFDGRRWLWLTLRSTSAVEAENLFLRRQLALYIARRQTASIDSITRIALTVLSGFFSGEMHWSWFAPKRCSVGINRDGSCSGG